MRRPRLRGVEKIRPPYPLNQLPANFAFKIGREIVYILATQNPPSVEGKDWERIFAQGIGADWTPSNVGLDDIRLGVCAWGAKSVKHKDPFSATKVRLISGRNSPEYSFDRTDLAAQADEIGKEVLAIWNGRVESLRNRFAHLRTVVLLKGLDFSRFTVFEFETLLYPAEDYRWERNPRDNLEAYDRTTGEHRFTWQPHGSQFTIIEHVPEIALRFKVRIPSALPKGTVLSAVGFDKSWVQVVT